MKLQTVLLSFTFVFFVSALAAQHNVTPGVSSPVFNLGTEASITQQVTLSSAATQTLWYRTRVAPGYSITVSPAGGILQANSTQTISITVQRDSSLTPGNHVLSVSFVNELTSQTVTHGINLTVVDSTVPNPLTGKVSNIRPFSTINFVNNATTSGNDFVTLRFWDSTGAPMAVPFNGSHAATHLVIVPANGRRQLPITFLPDALGTVEMLNAFGTTEMFVQSGTITVLPGRSSTKTKNLRATFDNSSVILGNNSSAPQTLFLQFRSDDGVQLGTGHLYLEARGSKVIFLNSAYSFLSGRTGVMIVTSNSPGISMHMIDSNSIVVPTYEQ